MVRLNNAIVLFTPSTHARSNVTAYRMLLLLFVTCLFPTALVFAQGYVPLAPLIDPATGSTVSGGLGLTGYLELMFRIGIAFAGALAVLMLVIAGIEYVGSAASEAVKSDAKNRMWNAIWGLLLALLSWILLTVINPDLTVIGI